MDSCPKTIEEWNARAELMNCTNVPNDCPFTEDKPLVYHCVKDRYELKLLEVCSKVWKSQGQCVDYEPSRNMVTSNFHKNCTTCPGKYNSTDIYKIPECYQITSIVKPHPIATTTSPTHHETGSWLDFVWLFVIIIILLLIILTVVVPVFIIQVLTWCRARRNRNRSEEDADTAATEMTELHIWYWWC